MTVLASDNFTRANSTGLGSNWITWTTATSLNIVSDQAAAPTAGNLYGNIYTAVGSPNDQYSKTVLGSIVSATIDEGAGPQVRMSAVAQTGYLIQSGGDTRLYRCIGTNFVQLGTTGSAGSPGDILELDIVGNILTARRGGVVFLGTPVTDSNIATGAFGVFGSTSNVLLNLASWEGGDFSAGPDVLLAQACY